MRPVRLLAAAPAVPVVAILWASIAMAVPAAAAVVDVRVEGGEATLYEGAVDTAVHPVDGGDGTGPHTCSGAPGESPGPTVTGALDDALRPAGIPWRGVWSASSGDFLIDSIGGEDATPSGPWSILLNGVPTPVGGCSARVRPGDRVLLARDVIFRPKTLRLAGATTVEPGEPVTLRVTDERAGDAPVAGATVAATGPEPSAPAAVTGDDGTVELTVAEPGTYRFKATHPEGIRSNRVEVCVGTAGCADDPGDPGPPVRILKIGQGQGFLRGAAPLILRGRLGAGAVEARVRIALRHRRGQRCRAWSGPRRRLVRRSCGSGPLWFAAPSGSDGWSYRLRALPPGRYRLFARPVGIPARAWRNGVNRVDFTVRAQRLARSTVVRKASRYLRRSVRRPEVRESGLLAAWSTLALGLRRDPGAGRAAGTLLARRPASVATGELTRNLAALQAVRHGPGRPRGRGPARRRARMAAALAARQSADGSFGGNVNSTAMAILALPGRVHAARAAQWLALARGDDGGLGFAPGAPPDADTTGLAAWALARAGRLDEARRAGRFLLSLQNPDGGFPAMPGAASNAQSTGLALAGLRAARFRPARMRTEDRITPFHYLALLQRPGGRLSYAPGQSISPVWVTAQALIGLSR